MRAVLSNCSIHQLYTIWDYGVVERHRVGSVIVHTMRMDVLVESSYYELDMITSVDCPFIAAA